MQILEKNMTEGQHEIKKPTKPKSLAKTPEPSKGKLQFIRMKKSNALKHFVTNLISIK